MRERLRQWLCLRFQLVPVERYIAITQSQMEAVDGLWQLVMAERLHELAEDFAGSAWATSLTGISKEWGKRFLELQEYATEFQSAKPDRFAAAERMVYLLTRVTIADCELPQEEVKLRREFRDAISGYAVQARGNR